MSDSPEAQPHSHARQRKPLRVLCLDGGGMRGIYTAAYLCSLADVFAKKRGTRSALDIGAAFDLICGTSTGAIIGCALALGIEPRQVVRLYRQYGPHIFRRALPGKSGSKLRAIVTSAVDIFKRPAALAAGEQALRQALVEQFGEATLAEVYAARKIALAVPAIDIAHHRSWVFKTPHLHGNGHRDDNYRLVDVCLATSAAPLFRSMAAIPDPNGRATDSVFVDGGLWANNPVLVGLIDALQMAAPDQPIEIFCLGTCPLPAGEDTALINPHRGLLDWKFGGEAAALAIDAQMFAYNHMARMLCRHVRIPCEIIEFPREQIPAALMGYLGLDETSEAAANALIKQANSDANLTNSRCNDLKDGEGQKVNELFMNMPVRRPKAAAAAQS
jgi:uncharacterized protein